MPSKVKPGGAAIAALLLIIVAIWKYPAADLSDPRFSMYFWFEIAAIAFFCFALWKINPWWAMFFGLVFISHVYPKGSMHSMSAYRACLYGFMWLYFVTIYVKQPEVNHLMDAMCIIALFNAIFLMFQAFGIDPIWKPRVGTATPLVGFMTNRNETSALLAICFPAFLRPKWMVCLIPVGIGMALTQSVGGMLAAVSGIFAYNIFKRNYKAAILLPIVGIFAYATFALIRATQWFLTDLHLGYSHWFECFKQAFMKDYQSVGRSVSSRWDIWRVAWKLIEFKPLMGFGIGHWKVEFFKFQANGKWLIHNHWWKHAHNEFVQVTLEMGQVGMAIICGYFVSVFHKLATNRSGIERLAIPLTAIVVSVVSCSTHFTMHNPVTAMVILTWIAILQIQLYGDW